MTRVTIADVARQAAVSVTTVSHALNGRGQVDPATRQKVQEVARALGYTPNRHAQKLRGAGSSMIALMSSMPFAVAGGPSRLGFLMEVASVASACALERGMAMVLVPPLESGQRSVDFLDVDGVLLIEPSADDRQLGELMARGVPVVSIGKAGGTAWKQVPCVDLQSQLTVKLLLDHLRGQGAQQIAMVLGTAERDSYQQAELAYQDMAAASGMKTLILRVDESQGEAAGREAAQRLLSEHPQIDAMLVLVDVLAVGVLQHLNHLGLRAPQDIILATRYDGIRARTSVPAMTAVNLHLGQVAELAVDLLLARMKGASWGQMVQGPVPDLVVRASTR